MGEIITDQIWPQDHQAITDLFKISVSYKIIVYHNITIKICSWQLYNKTLLIAFEFCQCFPSRDIKSVQFFT